MKVVRDLEGAHGPTAVSIGTFDGVHVGHRHLIAGTIAIARERELRSAVVTWDRHPAQTVRPKDAPPLLTSLERKLELLEETGVDVVVVLTFDEAFSRWSPERFVGEVIVEQLGARLVRVGHDWRFGHRATGDTYLLGKLGADLGFEVDPVRLENADDEPVSSTRIRAAVAAGRMEIASTLLGRPYDVDGVVVRGDGRGRTLGYPTANLDILDALARPAQGVYAGRIRVRDHWYRAAVNVGKNLTFGGEVVRVEAYVLDFDSDIYTETLRLEFHDRLRDELRFDSVEALVRQMDDDVAETRLRIVL